tara:strand:- start:3613 stop:4605 length:993 start_codon:yes stop_codon:yes gene_type:complete
MKKIGVIIGTEDEPVSMKYYRNNKSILKCLEEYGVYEDFIPYDYAIFAEIKNEAKKKKIEVIPLFGNDLTLKECNTCDYIFTIFEGVYSFMNGKYPQYNKFMDILKKTSATVFPSQKTQQFIIDKHKYLSYLMKKGYKITPTKFINLSKVNVRPLMTFIEKNDFNEIVLKPELGAFKTGFKVIKKPDEQKLTKALNTLKKNGYKRLLLQEFLSEFNKFGEIKTYWINGKNIYSYKQQWEDGEGVFNDEKYIEKDLLKSCLETGEQLCKDFFKDHENLIQCRIDFACCMNNDKICREFFVNEIEISPTIGEQESNGKAYKLLAKEVVKRCV